MNRDRPFPHSLEFERAILGGLIQSPERFPDVLLELHGGAIDFYQPIHEALYGLLLEKYLAGTPLDMVSTAEAVMRGGLAADRYGGVSYVVQLADHVPATANLAYYAAEVHAKAERRRAIVALQALTERMFDEAPDHRGAIGRAFTKLLTESGAGRSGVGEYREAVDEAVAFIDEIRARGDGLAGMGSGFRGMDAVLQGLQDGRLYVIAGRPGMGKTALLLQLCEEVALQGNTVLLISLEMKRREVAARTIARRARLPFTHMVRNEPTADEWKRYHDAAADVRGYQITVVDQPCTVHDVVAIAKAEQQRRADTGWPLRLVAVDYVQLLEGHMKGSGTREQEVREQSGALKGLAMTLGCPVMIAAQLNRDCDKRAEHRPRPDDLRESGALEQDADVILFPYREWVYDKLVADPRKAEIIVAKNRGGGTGTIPVEFDGPLTSFEEDGLDL